MRSLVSKPTLQRTCACGSHAPGPSGECAECRRRRSHEIGSRTLGLQTKLAVNTPGDRYEQEADRVADKVMRMNVGAAAPPISIQRLATTLQRQDDEEEAPDPITEGLGTVGENLGENNPEFTALTERLADDFLRQPAALSVGVPVFLGTNYAFLWGMALANPAMRQHLDDFNFGTLPGIIPQFPIKTFTYRILNEEQTRFEFDIGLDVSALMEAFNEGTFNTHISTLSLETSGGLDTDAASPVSLSSLQVNLGLFDDGLMLAGGFRSGVSPYPLFERNDLTGERFRIMEQVPALPDLYPAQQDVRFLIQLDLVRLYHHFNPEAPPIHSVPQQGPLSRAATAPGPATAPPSVEATLSSPGQTLDTGTRQFMEQRFGHDFGQVRIHADDRAAASADDVEARAYTVGADVVFGRGQYAPGTEAGRRLLAHELTHVVQQASSQAHEQSHEIALQREQASTLGAGNLLFESAPEFPGCSPYERFRLDYQLLHARNMVRIAEADVGRELARTDRTTGIITLIGSAISQYFHTTEERHIRTLLTRLGRIAERLERGPRNWRCIARCASQCGKEALACASPTVPVYVCPTHFEQGDTAGALTLVHEAAHQAGLGLPTPQGYRTDIYEGERRFPTLTTTQALNTPDAYKALVRDSRYGGPLPPSRAWTPRKTIIGDIHDPRLDDLVGWSDGRRLRIPPRTVVENRFRGVFVYDEPAHRPGWFDDLPDPEVSLRIVLRRSGNDRDRRGRPRESTLFDQRGSAAPDEFGRINAPGTENGFEFDLSFDKADRGTLHITAQIRDEALDMTVTYTDQVPVRPTAAPELVGTPTGTPEAPETEAPPAPPLQIQRLATAPSPITAPPSVEATLAMPSQALDTGTRQFMEQRFGHDFGQVRIHADDRAAASADDVEARAYTVGADVVFGQGQYAPGTEAGRRLLAHELTHVVQQASSQAHEQSHEIALQRKVVVDKPKDPIPNPGGKGVSQTNADTIRGYLSTLCVDGKPTVDGASGVVDIAGSFCFEPVEQIGHEGFATGPAPLEASKTRSGCSCLCDLVHSTRHLWTIRVDDVNRPHTAFDDTDAARGLKPGGTGGTVTTISPNSPSVFGSVSAAGKRIDYDPWLILGHELCGHGWLGSFGMAESKATFENVGRQADTIDRENALRAEHGIEARGRRYRDPFCGESYERLKTDAPGKETLAFVDLCKQKRTRCKKPGGGSYRLEETIPDTVAC